ncbi:MAG: toprim domain-containing protein [Planctomycetes bacterium]|nr:toprim domain-containing protein [Planctomycetota bacterium]
MLAVRPVRIAAKTSKTEPASTFSPTDAARVWAACVERVRDDDAIDEDEPVYTFLRQRCLAEAWEERPHVFGILPLGDDPRMPPAIRRWNWTGHRLVVPLYGTREKKTGQLINIQSRHIGVPRLPKGARLKLFPAGSIASGTAFANGPAIEMLRGGRRGERVVITEGLTDFLTHAIEDDGCVLGVPGASMTPSAIGAWARGRVIVLFLDTDEAGLKATRDAARRILDFGGKVRRGSLAGRGVAR